MPLKKLLSLLFAVLMAGGGLRAQELLVGVDFDNRFDNREYAGNEFNVPQTLFSARLTPFVGIEWMEKNRLVVGVEMLRNFGQYNAPRDPFMSDVKPLMYYRFKTPNVQADAGIFDRGELMGDYSAAFFSDSTRFYHNRLSGFLGRYVSTERPGTYIELALDWEGMFSAESREMFRILSAGRYSTRSGFYVGYALSLFHFAGSTLNRNVTDNLLLNPHLGWKFNAFFDFDIRGGLLAAPQRGRGVDNYWRMPCGGQLDIAISRWGVKLENNLYLGQNLQPLRGYIANAETGATYAAEGLYAGESFYATTKHVYNRTWLGYDRRFFHDTLHVEAGMVFHYDGTGMGTQQVVQLSVNLQRLFDIGPRRPAPGHRHGHGPLH